METQESLFHDDVHDAFKAVVAALGGAKKVAAAMRPDLPADDASKWLSKCLDPERAEKLTLHQIVYLLREGRRIGCHAAMRYLADDAGYTATPVEPEDERAQLMRAFNESVRAQTRLVERMERLASDQAAPALRRAI